MKRTYLGLILTLLFSLSFAQQSNLGPHGGRIKTAGKYKVELLGCDNYLEVYLYDADTNAVNNKEVTGSIEFYYNSEASLNSTLVRYGMDGFTARIPNNTFFYSKVTFDINGLLLVTEKFDNECLKRN